MRRRRHAALVSLRSDLKVFVRNPAALFFSAILPVVFLICSCRSSATSAREEFGVKVATLQVPAFIALAVVSSSFVGLAMGLTSMREDGILKRVRATPVAPWIVFAGRSATAFVSATIVTAILSRSARWPSASRCRRTRCPGSSLALAVGAATFCALGIAYTGSSPARRRHRR